MVNYCCVSGCGRNSRNYKLLNYYCLPKEEERQKEWLKLANRLDLLEKKPDVRLRYRVCSRHFAQSSIKNKHLHADAVPSLHLPGEDGETGSSEEELHHENIVCNGCKKPVYGFRYKCLTCPDYDLCSTCEVLEEHPNHYMIRIPKPLKFKTIQDRIQNLQNVFRQESLNDPDSSDDEPITKYVKKYDSGVDLSDDVKNDIRNEVSMMLNRQQEQKKVKKSRIGKKRGSEAERPMKKQKVEVAASGIRDEIPEVVFADVNEANNSAMEIKHEVPVFYVPNAEDTAQPTIQMKLSDDLSMLVIDMNNQKTLYSL
ncbi:uncharacterized protein LOC134201555 [Bombyx mori]|uniref:uncharacterized protein LOC134201555 n=1 Tax=Bombyx mori TaxID=7091 RepID=UPI002ED58EF8